MTKKIISCKIKNNDYLPIALEIIYLYLFISRKISKYGFMMNNPCLIFKRIYSKVVFPVPINRKIDCFGRHYAILKNKTLNQKIHWKASKILFGHLGWVRVLKLNPTKNWFVSGSSDRTLKFWEYPGGILKKTLTGHIEQITDCDINQEFRNMLSCGLDKLIKCWDIDNFKSTCSYYGHKSGVYVLKILQRFNIFASGGRDCVCRVWDIRSNFQYYSLSGHKNTITSMVRGSEQIFLITGSLDRTIKLWDINSGICFQTLNISNCPIRQLHNGIDRKSFFILQRNSLFKLRMTKVYFLRIGSANSQKVNNINKNFIDFNFD
mmetsp:Transcript_28337/g.49860  ORF Transcript_28337/g.49860 Transcript_28337/m.49860 type:complete len:321 (+) Transcript_28337:17-979(+)